MPTTSPRAHFEEDLLTPAYLANPYSCYAELRRHYPRYWSERLNAWILTRYEDVHAALNEPRLVSGRRVQTYADGLPAQARAQLPALYHQIGKWIGNMDAPDHTRLRRLVNTAFTPLLCIAPAAALEAAAVIRGICRDLLTGA